MSVSYNQMALSCYNILIHIHSVRKNATILSYFNQKKKEYKITFICFYNNKTKISYEHIEVILLCIFIFLITVSILSEFSWFIFIKYLLNHVKYDSFVCVLIYLYLSFRYTYEYRCIVLTGHLKIEGEKEKDVRIFFFFF